MKIKNLAPNALIYFIYFFGSCFVVMLAEALLTKIVNQFVLLDYFPLTIIRVVIYSIGVPAIIAALGYFEGYREAYISHGETAISCALALIPHILFAMLFKFEAFVSGAVRFVAGFIHNGTGITNDNLVNKTPYHLFLIVFAAYGIVYSLVLLYSRSLGASKRLCDRAELRKNEED